MRSRVPPCVTPVLALVLVGALLWVAPPAFAATNGAGITPTPFLHVVAPTTGADRTPYLADPAGREVLLHGVAAVGMQDVAYPDANGGPALFPVAPSAYQGTCPKASPLIPQPPLCEVQASKSAFAQSTAPARGDDFAQMRALGFNVVRLVLNWSQLEPTPGTYSSQYLARVAQVVGWAHQQGIYVILDMHQDQYSRYILPASKAAAPSGCVPSGGSDGAPAWAVMTDGKPGCAVEGIDDLNPAEGAAFLNFWDNATVPAAQGSAPGPGLEDHYIGALAALANRFEDDSTVLGYELMNEPQPGSLSSIPVTNAYQASSQQLYPFYTRAVEALTGVRDGKPTCPTISPTSLTGACAYPQLAHVTRQQIFFEPFAYRNLTDFSIQVSAPFSSYPNLVYAPHIYTYAFTINQEFLGEKPGGGGYPPNYTFGYQTAEAEAQAMHAAVFTTEFGDAASTDATIVSQELTAQEATLTGGTLWAWKGLSRTAGSCWCVRWQHSSYQTTANGTPGTGNPSATPSPDDLLIPSRQDILARVWPEATAGVLGAYRYDPATGAFLMTASATMSVRRGDRTAETVVYIPDSVHGSVSVGGHAVLDAVLTRPDGSRLAYVAPQVPTAGATPAAYTVSVGTPSRSLRSTVAVAAAHPPAPISEPQARALLLHSVQVALHSPNKQVRSNAPLVEVLAQLVLGSSDPNGAAPTPSG
ncbi:MAG: glycoside hydrolase family 5 protein [Acidimicrobiales bacterium]